MICNMNEMGAAIQSLLGCRTIGLKRLETVME